VVTGASTGIGEACAVYLDKLGLRIFAGVRKQADADALQRKASARLTPIFVDVTDVDSIAAAANTVGAAVGEAGVTGLVNNAGIGVGGPLEFLPLVELRTQLEVNVIGQIAVTQAFLPLLRRGQGRVVNMSSISGRLALPFFGPYAASKFALEALTDSLRVELRPWGIEVVAVEPGTIATPIWNKSMSRADEMISNLPERARNLYDPSLIELRKAVARASQQGIPAEKVAKVVAHALLAKRPKTRYVVGRDARLVTLVAKFLPDRLRDWLISRQLPSEPPHHYDLSRGVNRHNQF
jgi:NAD(P)-dependent dehydrogenase (short-subunit alcohol dehydrogenase family)